VTDRYAVFGNPVAHSRSPLIHSLFAKQTAQDIDYDKQAIALGAFAESARLFFSQGGKGLNVTVPFKLDAFEFALQNGTVSERAHLAGAVNTLKVMPDRKIFGDNTDGVGLVRDITENLGWAIKGKHVLILGAGGAVRGIMPVLLEQQPKSLTVVNRTSSKAETLANIYVNHSVRWSDYARMDVSAADLIINGTSAGLTKTSLPLPDVALPPACCAYDMMYGAQATDFMQWATQCGCRRVADGLGMLVEQAAESFFIWRGIRPHTHDVIRSVRQQLC